MALDIREDGGLKATELGDQVHGLLIELADNRYLTEFSSKLSALMKLTRNLTKHQPNIEEHSKVAHLKNIRMPLKTKMLLDVKN